MQFTPLGEWEHESRKSGKESGSSVGDTGRKELYTVADDCRESRCFFSLDSSPSGFRVLGESPTWPRRVASRQFDLTRSCPIETGDGHAYEHCSYGV